LPAGRALYTENCAEIKKSCAVTAAKSMAGLFGRRYLRRMTRPTKILMPLLFAGLGGVAACPAMAQDAYGLTNLKPYGGAVGAPPANGLARVIRSQKPETSGAPPKAKWGSEPWLTIHASGAVMIDSKMH
jgi:hypothetical protein